MADIIHSRTADSNSDSARLRKWATYASVSVALILILAKLAAYLITGSVALLSSLVDSTADLAASLVTLFGVRHALRPPDLAHRFGHGKAEALAALGQAAFVTGSAVFLTYEAVNRLLRPQAIEEGMVGIIVMLGAIALTAGLVTFQRYVIRRTGSVAIGADSLHYRGDLLMNLAVIAALLLTKLTGWLFFDPLFALGIAAFLIVGAYGIGRSSLDVLMDRELPPEDRDRIRAIVMTHEAARGMHDLRTRNSGNAVFIELHLELDSTLSLGEAHDITDEVERRLLQAFPNAELMVHQEPAGLEDERLDARIEGDADRNP